MDGDGGGLNLLLVQTLPVGFDLKLVQKGPPQGTKILAPSAFNIIEVTR